LSRDLARSGSNSSAALHQVHRVARCYDRFPADRGTSHAPTETAFLRPATPGVLI